MNLIITLLSLSLSLLLFLSLSALTGSPCKALISDFKPELPSFRRHSSFSSNFNLMATFTLLVVMSYLVCSANAQLSANFYATTCRNLQTIVRNATRQAVNSEPRMGASLLRMFFHDCFVNGCDGSILLDDTATLPGEKNALPNKNSVRGYEVIDDIKAQVEKACPATVSCADILALAARDGVVALGGPSWTVQLGRRDATIANLTGANTDLPSPFADVPTLISMFQAKGLNTRDMIALSGAHTIGLVRCVLFRNRIYNETNIDPNFAAIRKASCPANQGNGDDNLAPLDVQTSAQPFDNLYYQNLLLGRGLLHSDQVLFSNGSIASTGLQVLAYSASNVAFFRDFGAAMVKMSNISPLIGTSGEIRRNCKMVN
ncbi:peroxidase P7-like [Malania oleifera]|uniref:peroxidase P7-like n=1 Tax=Malania oleifera TaxID=397392 RepID=UPI0025AE2231|nr:peroxidase P7-like [Malania oleifera]